MRPLIVLTGQGVARADGLDLTRRLKALPRFAALTAHVGRKDRQNLDVLLEACGAAGEAPRDDVVRAIRAICLKERRTTQRKTTHRGVFEALAETARQRLVVHLTTNVDGLTTTFAVRDFGACWPPFRAPATQQEIVAEVERVLAADRGMIHFPVHGEAGLVVAEPDGALQTFYGEPRLLRGDGSWQPSLGVGLAAGIDGIEQRLLPSRLGYGLFDALLGPGQRCAELVVAPRPAADLLVIGYGAEDRGGRAAHPFESRITRIATTGGLDPEACATALLHRPEQNERSASWFRERGFTVLGYGDDDLPRVVRAALEAPAGRTCCVAAQKRVAPRAADDPPCA